MSYENIPLELRRLSNWVIYRTVHLSNGKMTKIPCSALTGKDCDVTNQHNLVPFELAVERSTLPGYAGIGFAFTDAAGYGGIDFDDCHLATPEAWQRYEFIIKMFDSYTEFSPSGNGLHTIIKANTPNGRRRDGVELYTQGRFFTFTGKVYGEFKPIAERQELAMQLYTEMGNGADAHEHYIGDAAPKEWTEDVIKRAVLASNGQLFDALMRGEWQACGYPSQSEADQALMNIIVFYTKNRAQASQIFKMSGLAKRDKAQRYKYIEYTMDKAFDQTMPPLDFSDLVNNINATIAANKLPSQGASVVIKSKSPENQVLNIDPKLWRTQDPGGVMGDVMQYFLAQSPRPIRDISLLATIGLFAGICGRAYNVSNTGLNMYLMLLAPTGSGKEAMRTGVNSLMHAVAHQTMPAALDFLGPSDMASGAGLLKHLADRAMPSFLSLTGEVGLRMQQLSSSNANQAEVTLRKVLLDLYPASKKGGMIRPMVYSDKKNNVEMIHSPNFTWLGESTGDEFYKSLNETQILSGLIPRFSIVEYKGIRPEKNENHANAFPSPQLIEAMRKLCETSIKLNQEGNVIDVAFTPEANELQRAYDKYCDSHIDNASNETLKHIWNRADLKAMKIAALFAISVNLLQPTIDLDMMKWSISFVQSEVTDMMAKFETGSIGVSGFGDGCRTLANQMTMHMEGKRKPSNNNEYEFMREGCVSRTLMMQMTAPYKAFKEDKRLFNDILIELEKQGVLIKLNRMEATTRFNSRAEIYQVADIQWFYDSGKS